MNHFKAGSRARWFLGLALFLSVATSAFASDEKYENLVQDLKTGPEYKRILTIQALRAYADPKAQEQIVHAMLYDHAKPVRRAAQRALAKLQIPSLGDALVQGMKSRDRRVRMASLEAMGLVRDPEGADWILRAMKENPEDMEVVLTGLSALREFAYRTEPRPGFEKDLAPFLHARFSWWLFTRHDQKNMVLATTAILGILARPGSLPDLMPLWAAANSRLKVLLADAFANIGWRDPVPLLQSGLEDRDEDVVIHCLYALGHIQAFSALDKIRGRLQKEKDPRLAIAGINALLEIPDPDNVPVVLALLSHPDLSVRHWAVYALGQMNAQAAGPALVQKLGDPSPLVRATAAMALSELRFSTAQPELLKILGEAGQADEVRLAAAKALMAMKNNTGADIYWAQLQRPDLDLDMRLQYALALGSCQVEKYREILAEEVLRTDFTRSFLGALALGIMGDARAIPVLIQTLDHGNPAVRRYAILGLEAFNTQEVLSDISQTANSDYDPRVRILCASRLAASGYAEYRVLLWNILENASEDIRSEALIGLGRSADADTLKQLKWYLRREPSVPVRETIWRILRNAEEPQTNNPARS